MPTIKKKKSHAFETIYFVNRARIFPSFMKSTSLIRLYLYTHYMIQNVSVRVQLGSSHANLKKKQKEKLAHFFPFFTYYRYNRNVRMYLHKVETEGKSIHRFVRLTINIIIFRSFVCMYSFNLFNNNVFFVRVCARLCYYYYYF